jgi:excinuclease ABC subunit C
MGTEIVASMVVMEDGLAKRSDYRRFKIRSLANQDDFAAMTEVLTRRFTNYLREREEGVRAGKRFSYPPNLVLIDGGKGQLAAGVAVLEELGLEEIPVAALAKRFEDVYRPGDPEPIRIPRDSEALYLLQAVRDEAHRFAITYHRSRRDKAMTKSVLDDIPGLGPGRRKRLLKEFGSVKKLRAMSEEELLAVPWLPDAVGRRLHDRLHAPSPPARSPAPAGLSSWSRDE